MDAAEFLQLLTHHVTAAAPPPRVARLGTVDPAHPGGRPRVTWDGEDTLSVKAYPHLADYVPAAGDRVAAIPVGSTWLVLGDIQ